MEIVRLPLAELEQNIGQIPDLPMNPREWTQTDIDSLARSIKETPELFEARPCLVVPYGGKYVILAGNLRYDAARQNGETEVPAIIFPAETPIEKMKEIVIKDNGSWGKWSMDALANEWYDRPLGEWGVPAWETEKEKLIGSGNGIGDGISDGISDEDQQQSGEKIEFVEELLREAMRNNVREAVDQINYTMKRNWIASFFTEGACQAKFLRAKYYGEHYPQYLSLYFCPERFFTSANTRSCYEQFVKIANGDDDGIAGLRTVTSDNLLLLLKGSYPFAGARMPMDFPANKARELIEEFGGKGCKVLDPCHGWGGATLRSVNGRRFVVLRR